MELGIGSYQDATKAAVHEDNPVLAGALT